MKRTAISCIALLMIAAMAHVPAQANGNATGSTFRISASGFPDFAYLGSLLRGCLDITVADDAGAEQSAQVQTCVHTPLGRAVLASQTVCVVPGETRVVAISYPILAEAPTGPFRFEIHVTIRNETLAVEHEVYVVGGK